MGRLPPTLPLLLLLRLLECNDGGNGDGGGNGGGGNGNGNGGNGNGGNDNGDDDSEDNDMETHADGMASYQATVDCDLKIQGDQSNINLRSIREQYCPFDA